MPDTAFTSKTIAFRPSERLRRELEAIAHETAIRSVRPCAVCFGVDLNPNGASRNQTRRRNG